MEHFNCTVESVTYHNEENGYSVLTVTPDNVGKLVTLVGNVANPVIGSTLYVEGDWKWHSMYGKQFVATLINEIMPDTVYGIRKYLGSGLIKGVGPATADKIVDKFGIETADVIENHPERLKEIPRLGQKKIDELVESWNQQKYMFDIMVFLKSFDISTIYAIKIYKKYGNESIKVLKENPYQLIDAIDGIGFVKADAIAIKMGYDMASEKRREAGIKYTLYQFAEDGNTYVLKTFLSPEVANLLSLQPSLIDESIEIMVENECLIEEDNKIFLPYYYMAEKYIADKMYSLLNSYKEKEIIDDVQIDDIEKHLNIEYNEEQREAIKVALSNNIMVLTGGPGTGKTTVTKGIITAFRLLNKDILLAAPTGKAADRMSDATGGEAKTIHRLLEYNPRIGGFVHNEDFPLFGDVLILDETSMINVPLMHMLLKAVPLDMKLVLIGDVDQLPCIGAGNILSDLIKSGMIPVVKLEKIFRQAASSKIITTAHAINHGEIPNLKNEKDSDLFFMTDNDETSILNTITELVKTRLPLKYKINPLEIQVLTPMKKGVLGTKNLNDVLQEVLNKDGGNEIKFGDTIYREKDKVMQIKNNYDKGVFNGDSGFIQKIDTFGKTMTVVFRKQIIDYEFAELDELMLAYAVTVHKSQGSEYPIVVMPLTKAHYMMMKRNLVYTGITRAKSLCVLVGQKQTLYMAINTLDTTKRNTYLKEFLNNE